MHNRIVMLFLFIFISTIGLSVVAQDDNNADRLQIVASYTILEDVIKNVTGDAADVSTLIPVGADPHSFQPTPHDIARIADADVVFINGALFEEGLLEAIENADTEMNIIIASSCIEIVPFGAAGHGHDEDEMHADDTHEGDDHADEMHTDDEHSDEHADDHHDESMTGIAALCAAHHDEMAALHEDSHDHGDEMHDDEHADDEHADDEHADDEHADDEHADDEHADDEHAGHGHAHVETLGMLYAIDCGDGHSHGDEDHGDEDHSDEDHADEASHDHSHDHGSCDPHVWMEPHNVMFWTMYIRDTLIDLDPTNAETYTSNASAYLAAVDALAHDFVRPMIETIPEENRILVTNHEALGYFAAAYGFEVVDTIIAGGGTITEPSAADVATVIDTIREEGVSAIFAETTVSDALAEQIAAETGAQVYTLYTGSLSPAGEPASTYLDYMRYNVTTIVEALGGGM